MDEQEQLLDRMLAQSVDCVKVLEPRIRGLVSSGADVSLVSLEKLVFDAVMHLGALWLGQVLTMYAAALAKEAGTRLPCRCGGVMRWVSLRTKTVLSLLGKVSYERVYYHCKRCRHGIAIGDRGWGLEHTLTTRGVSQLVGYLNASMSLVETAREICRVLCWPENWLSGKQVQRLAKPLGEMLGKMEAKRVGEWWETVTAARSGTSAEPTARLSLAESASGVIERLYVQVDGTLVRLRGKAGKKGSDIWREVKIGAVFVAETGQRVSHLAKKIAEAAKAEGEEMLFKEGWVDRPQGPITYVAGRVEAAAFGVQVYAEAVRRGLEQAKEVVVLGDGAHWIWELAEEHFPKAVQILDFWHASEWIWKVGRAVWGEGSDKAKSWAEKEIEEHLIEGDAKGLVKAIKALPPVPPPPGQKRSIPEQAATYFQNNAGRMRYPEYRARGMEIGSGTVESAAKLVVGQRCKGPGMRWSDEGLRAVLHLRTHVLNNRYDTAITCLPKAA